MIINWGSDLASYLSDGSVEVRQGNGRVRRAILSLFMQIFELKNNIFIFNVKFYIYNESKINLKGTLKS